MAKELAFALLNPYTLQKSRTGGVIGRLIVRTGMDPVASRMFGPSKELAEQFAELIRRHSNENKHDAKMGGLLADYILTNYAPDPGTGKRSRVMMLLFEGEDAIEKVKQAAGPLQPPTESADTVRATYGDLILDDDGKVKYLEPAVIVGTNREAVIESLKLWASFSETDGGCLIDAVDVAKGEDVEKTLVMLKPDNFRFPSIRPGIIIDIFAGSGLRIIGSKVHRMSVAEAEEFYRPVRDMLRDKLKSVAGERAASVIEAELKIRLSDEMKDALSELVGPTFTDAQFYEIIRFMTGLSPAECSDDDKQRAGGERTLALVYAGRNAINKIRTILGPTDPSKASPGSVRKEYGQSVMVNAAHASDSAENAEREMRIIRVEEDNITDWVNQYYD